MNLQKTIVMFRSKVRSEYRDKIVQDLGARLQNNCENTWVCLPWWIVLVTTHLEESKIESGKRLIIENISSYSM